MNILMIGPFPMPLTGESLANQELHNFLLSQDSIKLSFINTSHQDLSSNQGKFSFYKVFSSLRTFLMSYKIFKSDLVYVTPGQSFMGVLKFSPFILLSSLLNKKLVAHIHGGALRFTYRESNKVKQILLKIVLCRVSEGIVLSESLKENLSPFLRNELIHVVKNFASEEVFKISFDDKNFQKLKVLYLSNLMLEKGILEVIDTFIKIGENPNIEFTIVGKIEENNKEEIQRKISESGINYVGPSYGSDKINYLMNNNVLILPTYYKTEGQPISIIEGIVAGNYIITTRHAGIDEIVSESNGLFVKKKSSESIVNALEFLLKDMNHLKSVALSNYKGSRKEYRVERFGSDILKVLSMAKSR